MLGITVFDITCSTFIKDFITPDLHKCHLLAIRACLLWMEGQKNHAYLSFGSLVVHFMHSMKQDFLFRAYEFYNKPQLREQKYFSLSSF